MEDDIALSDIESLASEDRADVIPHQRLTINNTTALTAALNRISLPYSKLAFSEYQSITSDEPTDIPESSPPYAEDLDDADADDDDDAPDAIAWPLPPAIQPLSPSAPSEQDYHQSQSASRSRDPRAR